MKSLFKKNSFLFASIALTIIASAAFLYLNKKKLITTSTPEVNKSYKTDATRDLGSILLKLKKTKANPSEKSGTNNKLIANQISLADQYLIEQWQESLGASLKQHEIYQSYDFETLMQLAGQGDIYALQAASLSPNLVDIEDFRKISLDMQFNAAARGSAFALTLTAISAKTELAELSEGNISEELIREKYDLQNIEMPIEQALETIIAANYVTAIRRGNVFIGSDGLQVFQENVINRNFTKNEWETILANSDALYRSLENQRNMLGLDLFDNSYPEPYAKVWGLPEENTVYEQMREALNKL